MSGDDRGDRERLSWSEIDKLRDRPRERRDEQRPRSPAAQERAAAATKQYLADIDGLFSEAGGGEADRLAEQMREALGTPQLAEACRAYRDGVGMPDDPKLLSLFLDSEDAELVLAGLTALRAVQQRGELQVGAGLRSQLRMLAQGADDAAAEAAEEVLEGL